MIKSELTLEAKCDRLERERDVARNELAAEREARKRAEEN